MGRTRWKTDPVPFEKLPKWIRGVIERCRAGEVLCLHLRTLREPGDAGDWFFEPSGRRAPPASSQQAIRTAFLVPGGDGFFPDHNQTWRAAL